MRKLLAAFGILFTLTSAAHSNTIVIKQDEGGVLKDYMVAAKAYVRSNTYIVVDGDCVSACTLYFSYVPKSHICVTPKARIGFHWASDETWDAKGHLTSKKPAPIITEWWINTFPPVMKKWVLENHVMESDRVTYVPVAQLPFLNKCKIIRKNN